MKKGTKYLLGLGAAAALVVGGVAVAASGAVTPPPAGTISITVTPTQFTSAGGTATVSGTTTLANGTLLYAYVNNVKIGTGVAVSAGMFTITIAIAPNTSSVAVTDSVQVKNL